MDTAVVEYFDSISGNDWRGVPRLWKIRLQKCTEVVDDHFDHIDRILWEGKPLRNVTRYGASLSGVPFSHAYISGGQAHSLSL
ncbi:hypothetical protein EVAR_6936_1 [Eumeta japonica]|uniref:Uncharacterized protein n=1 Tax=Eumeta variegata TaxID=151549 RepID=A0A4C1THJ3_EUMVA|nr:hypothetical protein EVAR_6936_1 [Eumeta japonica]